MWKKFVNDYLRFTRKDRIGILVLVTLIVVVVLLPAIWPSKKATLPSKQQLEQLKAATARLHHTDSNYQNPEMPVKRNYAAVAGYSKIAAETFFFDPNTLDAAGWKRLGIRDKTAATIMHYLQKGGKFKKPEDLSRIYGLFKDDYERLLPYVQIKGALPPLKTNDNNNVAVAPTTGAGYPKPVRTAPQMVEINSADTSALIALPGIGAKLAARIVNFRTKLGGFYNVQQVAETFGLPDSTFMRIQPLLQCSPAGLQLLNINTADANTLKQHPYIRWNLANAIVQYRSQHGNFKSVEDLLQIALITPEVLAKIKPYVVI